MVAETQPAYGVVRGGDNGDGAGPWMRGVNLGSGQKGGGEGERVVGGERIVGGERVTGRPAPELGRAA